MEDKADKYKKLLAKDKLNIRNAEEVELWTNTLGIYTADLVAAVAEVGDSAARVFDLLVNRGASNNRERPPDPDKPKRGH